jgi:NAD(P)-dependent dehydrogenase (short-subunit alcohol dehydrogenase family)
MPDKLDMRRVVVTGASQGIGRVIAEHLASPGISLAACGSAPSSELQKAVDRIEGLGASVHTLTGDLADANVPARLVEEAAAAMGGLDGLVINAGAALPAPLAETEVADWDRIFAINVRASWQLAVAARSHLAETRGSIVLITSVAGIQAAVDMGAYSASKSAESMLMRQLALEWAAHGIRVNAVAPGYVATDKTRPILEEEQMGPQRLERVPLGRPAEPMEVAKVVAFLLDDDFAGYITGQELAVDGGLASNLLAVREKPEVAA